MITFYYFFVSNFSNTNPFCDMAAGTYLITGQIVISQSNVVLRGAGNGTTTLFFSNR